jgi:protein-S-isoprenylcysteine O-methyltransferase Ste14
MAGERRRDSGRDGNRRSDVSSLPSLGPRGEGWVAIQGVLLVAEAIAGIQGPAWDGPGRVVSTVFGLVVIALGAFLAVRGVVDLRDGLTPFPHPRDGASLVDTGSYRLVRHPIYGGLVIASLGWGLLTASVPAVLGAAVILAFFRLKSAREEAWLEARYPGYPAYRARTRRMLPFVY